MANSADDQPMNLQDFLANYKAQFSEGMVPFDIAYQDALDQGATPEEARRDAAHYLLDAFVADYLADALLDPDDDPEAGKQASDG